MVAGAAEEFAKGPFSGAWWAENENGAEWFVVLGNDGLFFHEVQLIQIFPKVQVKNLDQIDFCFNLCYNLLTVWKLLILIL